MLTKPRRSGVALALLTTVGAVALTASPASATSKLVPVTAVVSVAPSGKTGAGPSAGSVVSANGRYVAFSSFAGDLVPGDTNNAPDVFVRDMLSATTVRVSTSTSGAQGNAVSSEPSISRDGRYVAFSSAASTLVAGDTNAEPDVFVRDLRNKTTIRVDVGPGGAPSVGGDSGKPSITADGLQVAFESRATNLVSGDTNAKMDVFVRDVSAGTTEMVGLASNDALLLSGAWEPSISATGRYVAFTSDTNQGGWFSDSHDDVLLRDRAAGTTERISLANNPATHPNGPSQAGSISDDGRYVAFESTATNLSTLADATGAADVFVRDRTAATTDLVSQSTSHAPGSQGGWAPSINADGTKIAFASTSTNLVTGDTNTDGDVFVRNLTVATTSRASVSTTDAQLASESSLPAISSDGSAVTFSVLGTAAYPNDTNNALDIFVRSTFQIGPFAQSTGLIQRTIKDFTGSAPTVGAIVAANDKVLSGTATPASTINTYAHGTFDDHRGPIVRLYWAFFKRAPDLNGLNYWTNKHGNGTSIKTIANGFAKSSEFKTNFGSGTDSQFITLVYQNVLERNPDPAGLAHWVAKMKAGTTRGEMMTNFSESSEGIRRMRGEVDTVLILLGMVHRMPSTGEVISYANALELQGGQATEVLVTTVLTSPEYALTVN